jgi:SAM-dependent methyltransferase
MTSAVEHYENLLAEHYSWMSGDERPFEKALAQVEVLKRARITDGDKAIDLGAGPGYHAIALAELGFQVWAFDTSEHLLRELQRNCGARPVRAIHADLMTLSSRMEAGFADAIVCMGDTLTHLPVRACLPELFGQVAQVLRDGGRFVLSYRDLSTELKGLDRFIPVRSSADKVMTCFLEYGPETVTVHDLIHVREGAAWKLLKSSYPKLRLAVADVRSELEKAGLTVDVEETTRGMTLLSAARIAPLRSAFRS